MGVRPGYKLTEAGVIPEEWELSTVGRQFSVQLGKMLDVDKNRGTHKPYIGNRHVQWGRFDLSDLPTIALTPEDLAKYRLVEGDLLVCEGGEVGRSAIWNGADTDCYYQKALHRLRPIGRLNTKVMLYLFEYLAATGSFADFVTQTSIAHLPREKLVEVRIPLPSLHEQRAIAAALTAVDDLLASLDRLIAKKRAIKQGVMHDLLTGRKRLPGFSGEWEVQELRDLLRFQVGFPFRSQFFSAKPFGTRLVRNRDLKPNLDYLYYTGIYDNFFLIKNGDILIGMDGEFTTCVWKQGPALLNQRVGRLNVGQHASSLFLYYALQDQLRLIEERTGATTVKHISHSDIENINMPLPLRVEQIAIAAVLTDMDDEIDALQSRRDKTHAIKQAMMAELLTGRTRLI